MEINHPDYSMVLIIFRTLPIDLFFIYEKFSFLAENIFFFEYLILGAKEWNFIFYSLILSFVLLYYAFKRIIETYFSVFFLLPRTVKAIPSIDELLSLTALLRCYFYEESA